MSSSKQPRGKRYTDEQKRDIVARSYASGMSQKDFCAQEGISGFSLHHWRKKFGNGQVDMPEPDHVRDINQLALLNSIPPQGIPVSDDVDERVAKILGATIAEVMRRLKG